jgi:hypothetical protein
VCVCSQADSLRYFPLPRWYPLDLPSDHEEAYVDGQSSLGSGGGVAAASVHGPALLMCVQLIPVEQMLLKPVPTPSIVPPVRDAFVEVVVFGLRNLAPFNLQEMSNPQVCGLV